MFTFEREKFTFLSRRATGQVIRAGFKKHLRMRQRHLIGDHPLIHQDDTEISPVPGGRSVMFPEKLTGWQLTVVN
jgi:hypothetical protein